MKVLLLNILLVFVCHAKVYSQSILRVITLDEVINRLSLESISAKAEHLNYQNKLLQYENYKKGFLPAFFLNLNPVNFNRSLRLLQQPNDGSYSYVEDYSNNSSFGLTIRQKISITGGELSIGSDINYLNEFSRKQNSFSTTPFFIAYSQQLWGGGKLHRFEKNIEYVRNATATKQYCSNIAQIQQQALTLYLSAILHKMDSEHAIKTKLSNDTLLQIATIKLKNGNITEYDYKQIELQSLNLQYTHENAIKNYTESKQLLFTFLGICDYADILMPDFNLPLVIDTQTAIFSAKKNNPFFEQQQIYQLEAEEDLFYVKLNNRFNGNISLNYGMNQYAERLVDAYRDGNTRLSLVIGFQIPFFQWGIRNNKVRIAENNYKVSSLISSKKKQEFENEIKEKVNKYNHSIKLWITAEKAYNMSIKQYEMLMLKFALGKESIYELTTVQNELNNTMRRYYLAIKDTYESYFALRSLTLYDFKKNVDLIDLFINE